MTRFSGVTLAGLFVLAMLSEKEAGAAPLTVSDTLTFTTVDQGLWAPGTDPLFRKDFTLAVVDVDTGPFSIGAIFEASLNIPNPAYLAWSAAFNSCRALWSAAQCINGATINLGFTTIRVRGLGPAPAQNLSVSLGKNGLQITADIDVEAGFKGELLIDAGKVGVTYPTTVTLSTDRDSYQAGELVTLTTLETVVGTPTMSTEFSDLDMSISVYTDLRVKTDIEAYLAGEGGRINVFNVNRSLEYELMGVSVGNSEIGLRLFELAPIVLDTTGGLGTNLFKLKYPPCVEGPGGVQTCGLSLISLADFQLQVPDLDTAPPDDSTWNGTKIVNTQLPIDRSVANPDDLTLFGGGVGFHRTDVAKADIDVDGIISAAAISAGLPLILGVSTGIPIVLSVEANLIDFDLGAFFGFSQTTTFEPTLKSTLHFSVPVQVEISPGVFVEMSSLETLVGSEVKFLHPGVDLEVWPDYALDNLFTSITEFLISPVASLSIAQIKLGGALPGALGVGFDAALYQNVFALSDPISVAQLGNPDPFVLGGFDPIRGTSLFLTTADATVPEPGTLALLLVALFWLARARGAAVRNRRRPAYR